jgi:hypothetical protein
LTQAEVVPADTLEREIEPVGDPSIEPGGSVDGLLAIDPVARKDHHPGPSRVASALKSNEVSISMRPQYTAEN